MLLHGIGQAQGGIHADTVIAVELFGIHTTHRGTQDQVRLLLLTKLAQQGLRLFRMDGQVGCYDVGIGQDGAQARHRTALSATAESVEIHHCFPLHQFGKLLYVLVLLFHNAYKGTKKLGIVATFPRLFTSNG